jgi:hypothetical protein
VCTTKPLASADPVQAQAEAEVQHGSPAARGTGESGGGTPGPPLPDDVRQPLIQRQVRDVLRVGGPLDHGVDRRDVLV